MGAMDWTKLKMTELKANVPRCILQQHSVTKLEIAGTCVYNHLNKLEVIVCF